MAERYGKKEIEKHLKCSIFNSGISFFDEIDSTNLYAKRNAKQGLVVIAGEQTAGKGSHGRKWKSDKEVGIYMSFVLTENITPDLVFFIPILSAVCISKAIDSVAGVRTQIKWPNDILLNGRKLCGILTEADIDKESVIVGIGINVSQLFFDKEIDAKATSILRETGKKIDKNVLAAEILNQTDESLKMFFKNKKTNLLCAYYNSRLIHYNRQIDIIKGDKYETVLSKGINEKGQLLVLNEKGQKKQIYLGEVSVRGKGIYNRL